ncbi:MAG: M48 family metallopeptidase [Muribaculaceae bacterium]|nr:M48 family metallopeptidase [Muribaculaceae bacterium]
MKKKFITFVVLVAALLMATPCSAQFNLGKGLSALAKGAQALTLSDADMANYVKEYITSMDSKNPVSAPDSKYSVRLANLTSGLTSADGIPLNFKVYEVSDVNAFACPDGSVRVFAALMDVMSDEELLGVIGHEIGHVALRHSKNAFKHALLTSALRDAIGSASSTIGALTDSQLGDLAEALSSSKYSQKQENQADDFGYEFLKGAGKNPWAMALSFEKLKSLQGGEAKSNLVNQLFSSHPDLNSRIKRMTQRATKDGFAKP